MGRLVYHPPDKTHTYLDYLYLTKIGTLFFKYTTFGHANNRKIIKDQNHCAQHFVSENNPSMVIHPPKNFWPAPWCTKQSIETCDMCNNADDDTTNNKTKMGTDGAGAATAMETEHINTTSEATQANAAIEGPVLNCPQCGKGEFGKLVKGKLENSTKEQYRVFDATNSTSWLTHVLKSIPMQLVIELDQAYEKLGQNLKHVVINQQASDNCMQNL